MTPPIIACLGIGLALDLLGGLLLLRYDRLSTFALILMLLGFVLQIVGILDWIIA